MIPAEWTEAIAGAAGVPAADISRQAAAMEETVDSLIREGREIYPPKDRIFRALALTPPRAVRAVVLGQDPYHDEGQAVGLAFSVPPGTALPPSLKNIFRELADDIGCGIPHSGDLTAWTERGVLLLNTSLTVEAHKPASHARLGWSEITRGTILACLKQDRPIVFLLWGAHAQKAAQDAASLLPDRERDDLLRDKLFLCSAHPSPLSARRGFFGSRPFSRANAFLESRGSAPVDWSLP